MAKIKPSEKQLRFLDWEFGAFFHFGLRSYYKGYIDWDKRDMDLSVFNPVELDCESWLRPFKEAGARYAILVCKHHDGFANWPSRYTAYSVANTPWKNGKGDVVREFVDACRKLDMGVGLYYSPAQRDWDKFASNKDYDDYFINQVSELLTNYGKIDYLWFDGCGSEGHEYDKKRIIHVMRALQPDMLIFNMWDPDVRWVGNEIGFAPLPHSNVVSEVDFSVRTTEKDRLERESFLPAECDTKLRSTWFDCEDNEDTLRSLDELMGLYYMSVGHGANLLLNAGPDSRGLLLDADKKRIEEFGAALKRRFGTPIAAFGSMEQSPKWPDGYVIPARERTLVNHVVVSEDLTEGESVKRYQVFADNTLVYDGYCIGHKAICPFPTIAANRVSVRILDHDGPYRLKEIKAYYVEGM